MIDGDPFNWRASSSRREKRRPRCSTRSTRITIDKKEFDALYADLKAKGLTPHTKEKALENMNASGDEKISFKEFIEYLKNVGTFSVALPKA